LTRIARAAEAGAAAALERDRGGVLPSLYAAEVAELADAQDLGTFQGIPKHSAPKRSTAKTVSIRQPLLHVAPGTGAKRSALKTKPN
jgi:hypothetical protein